MNSKPKIIVASLISPIAILAIPLILNISLMLSDPSTLGATPDDDAPYRAIPIINAFLVIAYPILSIIMLVIGYALSAMKILSFKIIFTICSICSFTIGMYCALHSPFGFKDQVITFIMFGGGTLLCFSLGAVCWWCIAHFGHNNSFKWFASLTGRRKSGAP